MHDLEVLKSGGYRGTGLRQLKLTCPLASFPDEILELGDTLEQLDLSGTGLCSVPANFGSALPNLKVAFFSDCKFKVFPKELAACATPETVAFRHNGMDGIPEEAFPPRLRWLILTDNRITSLPASIGRCDRLQKCMLASNRLRELPPEMARCTRLGLLRLGANCFETLPEWLFTLPELAFLSFAGNPCALPTVNGVRTSPGLASIDWADLEVQQALDEGVSGITFQGLWKQSPQYAEEVAIKLFRGPLTSDGSPADEMTAWLAAGAHESLVTVLGRIHGHPDAEVPAPERNQLQGGIVMQLIPPHYAVLGQPPSLVTCTRDLFRGDTSLSASCVLSMLTGIAGAAAHIHARGISHGDLYAHNILASSEDAHALMGGFGAATIYGHGPARECGIEKLEVLAFAHLVEDMLGLIKEDGEQSAEQQRGLWNLHARCAAPTVGTRPCFGEVLEELEGMIGWRGMMRIPG
ncbi:Protein kinase domain-containing protein [Madurella fahalii]|uniref:Protein kinase domain-containing protein n=1 Tax=Madurella fahalii TaxID=1157608 RepID=A0ABQ0GPU0_9PEZI